MRTDDTQRELAALIHSDADRTKMGRFLEVFDLVDQAVIAGVKRDRIRATLQRRGLDLTPGTLNNYLSRARRARQHPPGSRQINPSTSSNAPPGPDLDTGTAPSTTDVTGLAPAAGEPSNALALDPTTAPSISEIRNQTHDLDAARRRWKQIKRDDAARAKAAADPAIQDVPLQPGLAPAET